MYTPYKRHEASNRTLANQNLFDLIMQGGNCDFRCYIESKHNTPAIFKTKGKIQN